MNVRDLKFIKHIGNGTFGSINLYETNEKRLICIKNIAIHENNSRSLREQTKKELLILSQIKHPRIIRFYDSFCSEGIVHILMEYAPHGTLRELIDRRPNLFSEKEILKIFCDILMGIEYLHIRNVIHRDLKPLNILLGQDGRIKIADFGISQIHSQSTIDMSQAGTPLYMAPEVWVGKSDFKTDIWSLGCILYELCTLKNPFIEAKNVHELYQILTTNESRHVNCNKLKCFPLFKILCEQMLAWDPLDRISVPQIVKNKAIWWHYSHLYFDYYQ